MAKRKTTPKERRKFIEEQRAAETAYRGHGRRMPVDMSFIDRKENIIHSTKEDYDAAIKRKGDYDAQHDEAIKLSKRYDALVSKYGQGSEEVYEFERDRLGMHRKRKPNRLEGGLALIGLIFGAFFLSSNIIGNAIGNMTNSTSNIFGVSLLIIGLVAGFFYLKSRK